MTGMDIAIVVVCVILAAVMFTVWLAMQIVMLIVRGVASLVKGKPAPSSVSPAPIGWSPCGHAGCRATNPDHARFCRRCGKAVAPSGSRSVPMRYVA